jgi:methylase of polypeptide subunit release factors
LTAPVVRWSENGADCVAQWRSESGAPPPARVVIADDTTTADDAYGLACQGTALLWRGDFQNARQMLLALARRADRRAAKRRHTAVAAASGPEAFHLYRQGQSQRARTLAALLVPLDDTYKIDLRRAPDVAQACREAYGPAEQASLLPLRALLGVIGAHEWRLKGINIAPLSASIHPHYGVFAPIRHEYVDLVAAAPLPPEVSRQTAFDIGTGTGVLAAVLLRRGVGQVVATDLDVRALTCARENLERLDLSSRVQLVETDLFPAGRAALAVCNPPWLPGRPSSALERGIYDPDSRMLRGFLAALPAHLHTGAEGWLILSDLAEHLGLRSRSELLSWFEAARLRVLDRSEVRPRHPRAADRDDPLHAARAAEVTSLWRLAAC